MAIEIKLELDCNLNDILHAKLDQIINHDNVKRDAASAVAGVLTRYVPRSDRPPSVHHLQDFEARDDGSIRWYGDYRGVNYAQRVYANKEGHTFHVRYPGHEPRAQWMDVLYDAGTMSQVETDVQAVLENAADSIGG